MKIIIICSSRFAMNFKLIIIFILVISMAWTVSGRAYRSDIGEYRISLVTTLQFF